MYHANLGSFSGSWFSDGLFIGLFSDTRVFQVFTFFNSFQERRPVFVHLVIEFNQAIIWVQYFYVFSPLV